MTTCKPKHHFTTTLVKHPQRANGPVVEVPLNQACFAASNALNNALNGGGDLESWRRMGVTVVIEKEYGRREHDTLFTEG